MKSYRRTTKKNKTKKNKKHYKGGGVNKSRRANKGNGAAPKKNFVVKPVNKPKIKMYGDEENRWDIDVISNQHDPTTFVEDNTKESNEYTCPKCDKDNLICTQNMSKSNIQCQCQSCLYVWFPNK